MGDKSCERNLSYAFNELYIKTLQIIPIKRYLGSVKVAENFGFIWKRTLPNEFTPIMNCH